MAMKQVQLAEAQIQQTTSISWSALFPHDTTTIIGSEIFIKQLTALIFSAITHIRGIFPEYAFDDRVLDDRKLKLLNSSCDCKNAYLMTRWLKSAFKALDLKYMQTLTLELMTLDNMPLEYYAIDYSYTNENIACSFYTNKKKDNAVHFSKSAVENATKKLIFALLDATEGLGDLPTTYQLQLRIHYYDDRTPATYTPEYFMNVPNYDWDNVQNLKRIRLGSVNTTHHSMSMNIGSTLVPSDGSDQPLFNYGQINDPMTLYRRESWLNANVEAELLPVSQDEIKQEVIDLSQSSTDEKTVETLLLGQTLPAENQSNDDVARSTLAVETGDEDTIAVIQDPKTNKAVNPEDAAPKKNAVKLDCFCEINQETETFICQSCGCAHHLVCYKFWPESQETENLNCFLCAKMKNITCIDEQLIKYPHKQAKNLMIYRQLLYKAQYLRKISTKIIASALEQAETVAQKFMKKFISEGFTKPTLNKDVFTVNCSKLNQYIHAYFHY